VCSDQEAVDLVRNTIEPTTAAKQLVDHALARFSTDNLSCMLVRFNKSALLSSLEPSSAIGVEGDLPSHAGKVSETEKIIGEAKRKNAEDGFPGLGVSGSNSGKGHDPVAVDEMGDGTGDEGKGFDKGVSMEKVVEEEADLVRGEPGPELDLKGAEAIEPEVKKTLKLPEGSQ
jgi:protein phosphatase PTC1